MIIDSSEPKQTTKYPVVLQFVIRYTKTDKSENPERTGGTEEGSVSNCLSPEMTELDAKILPQNSGESPHVFERKLLVIITNLF